MAYPRLSLLLAFAACADPASGGADLEIRARCAAIESLSLPATQVDQTANAFIQFINHGARVEQRLRFKLDGPNAAEFAVGSACERELAPDDFCLMEVRLTPTSVGDKRAVLHYGARELPLSGTAVAKSTGLFVSVANLDYAFDPGGPPSFVLTNLGPSALTIAPQDVDTDDLIFHMSSFCPMLPSGGVCEMRLGVAQPTDGCVSATAHIAVGAGAIDLPITSEYIATASASVRSQLGDVHGRITSDPPAIDCGAGGPCSARVSPGAIKFTATPAQGARFIGWSDPRCGMAPECTELVGPLLDRPAMRATFAPSDAKAINITFAGQGTGRVSYSQELGQQVCNASCTMLIGANEVPVLQAYARSQFGGWAGDCTGTNPMCVLGLNVFDRQLTVTFDKDPHEAGITVLPLSAYAGAYLPGGDLVVVGNANIPFGSKLARVTPSGAVVWTRFVVNATTAIATTADGGIYAVTQGPALVKLSADGVVQWRVALSIGQPTAIAAHGTDVLVGGFTGFEARAAADGAVRWSVASNQVNDIAVGPGGIIAISLGAEIHRFAADGTPMLPIWTAPGISGPVAWRLAYDAAGNLTTLSSGSFPIQPRPATLSRFTPSGALAFSVDVDATASSTGGPIVAAGDKLIALRSHQDPFFGGHGAFLEAYDGTGARLWQVDKVALRTGPGAAFTGFTGGFVVVSPDGTPALISTHTSFFGEAQMERLAP